MKIWGQQKVDKETDSFFHTDQLVRLKSFSVQGVLKQILTEGERYVVTFFYLLSLAQQGAWDSVTAIGALLPRLLYRPLEESFYIHFCHTASKGGQGKFSTFKKNLKFFCNFTYLQFGRLNFALPCIRFR